MKYAIDFHPTFVWIKEKKIKGFRIFKNVFLKILVARFTIGFFYPFPTPYKIEI